MLLEHLLDQHPERGIGRFKRVAFAFQFFERLQHFTRVLGRLLETGAQLDGFEQHAAATRKFRHQDLTLVADHLRLNVFKRRRVLAHRVDMRAALVTERARAHKGRALVRAQVDQVIHKQG